MQKGQAVWCEACGGQWRAQWHHPQTVGRRRYGAVEALRHRYGVICLAAYAYGSEQADACRLAFLGEVAALVGFDETVHLAERRDAGDRLLAVRPGVRDGAKQPTVDVDRAAAHAGNDPGFFQAQARQPAQNHVAARAGILQHAENFRVEVLDLSPLHHSSPEALHASADVLHLPVALRLGTGERGTGKQYKARKSDKQRNGQKENRPGSGLHATPPVRKGERSAGSGPS